ncbi:MAG TPA: S24 family peptidase [Gemmatimonadaceae bacterium]|nr:S24 family peptidase [Gemmatimonadaceae bacterium]
MSADEKGPRPATAWAARPDPESLAREVGRAVLGEADGPAWRDERFVEWLAREERARRGAEASTDADARARGEALLARAQARRLRVGCVDLPPTLHDAPLPSARRVVPVVSLGVAAGDGRELWDEPPQHWLALPDVVPAGDYLAFRIVGDSMTPLMHTDDTVLVQRGARVDRDTIVVARHPDDGYVCKRVHRVRRATIELASLAPDRPLITIPRDARLILGTVLMVWCTHRP